MINVLLKGVDEFLGAHVESVLSPGIASICKISNDDIIFTCLHSINYHGGVDQTSYHMILTLELEEKYREYECEIAEYILKASKNFAVHCHINFSYLTKAFYERIDEDYPLYVTSSNEILLESNEDEEVYTGDIFADFEEKLNK